MGTDSFIFPKTSSVCTPDIIESKVDFPLPFSPERQINSPFFYRKIYVKKNLLFIPACVEVANF